MYDYDRDTDTTEPGKNYKTKGQNWQEEEVRKKSMVSVYENNHFNSFSLKLKKSKINFPWYRHRTQKTNKPTIAPHRIIMSYSISTYLNN